MATKRSLGGYIEGAQLTLLGLEIYQDIHGTNCYPPVEYTIPDESSEGPYNLWGYELGKGVKEHIKIPILQSNMRLHDPKHDVTD